MKAFLCVLFTLVMSYPSVVFAQEDPRVVHLRDRILTRVPDIPAAARGLGRRENRVHYATLHARAIIRAADLHVEQWEQFAEEGGWDTFNPRTDLPALIAAIAFRESSFQPVIRLDNNSRVYRVRDMAAAIPADVAAGRVNPRRPRGDMGFMQVRVPGAPARACGATRDDMRRLLDDYAFNYEIGTCILTRSLTAYVEQYAHPAQAHMRWGQRPDHVMRFFTAHPELKHLVVLERYNWGSQALYDNSPASGYAVRVLREFLFFRSTNVEPVDASST